MIRLKRIYDERSDKDGFRILVDRLWPRGVSTEKADLDLWLKEIAPTSQLRQWFNHDPKKWNEFQLKYLAELKTNPVSATLKEIKDRENNVTLLYGARNTKHNEAVVIMNYLGK
jgi:uncharacterized protein YeaO (DUF488 family)